MRNRMLCRCFLLLLLCCTGCAHHGVKKPRSSSGREELLEVTAYCPCGSCCGWKRNWFGRPVYRYGPNKGRTKQVGVTASGTGTRRGTIAADTDRYPFGTVMYVPGYGYGRVEDRGRDIQGNHIDVFFPSHREALSWGRVQRRVQIWWPD